MQGEVASRRERVAGHRGDALDAKVAALTAYEGHWLHAGSEHGLKLVPTSRAVIDA